MRGFRVWGSGVLGSRVSGYSQKKDLPWPRLCINGFQECLRLDSFLTLCVELGRGPVAFMFVKRLGFKLWGLGLWV